MSDLNRGYARTIPVDRADMSVDAGLRSFMLGVYNKVALGLLLSAALAFLTGTFPPVRDLMFTQVGGRVGYSLLGMVVAFAPLAILLVSSFAMRNPTPKSAGILYWIPIVPFHSGRPARRSLARVAILRSGESNLE